MARELFHLGLYSPRPGGSEGGLPEPFRSRARVISTRSSSASVRFNFRHSTPSAASSPTITAAAAGPNTLDKAFKCSTHWLPSLLGGLAIRLTQPGWYVGDIEVRIDGLQATEDGEPAIGLGYGIPA